MKYVILARHDVNLKALIRELCKSEFRLAEITDTPTDIETDLETKSGNITQYISQAELEKSNLIVLDPDSLTNLADKFPEESFHILHFTTTQPTALEGNDLNLAKAEDKRYTLFEDYVKEDKNTFADNMTIFLHLEYNSDTNTTTKLKAAILGWYKKHQRLCTILDTCVNEAIYPNQKQDNISLEILADCLLVDEGAFQEVLHNYLTLPKLSLF